MAEPSGSKLRVTAAEFKPRFAMTSAPAPTTPAPAPAPAPAPTSSSPSPSPAPAPSPSPAPSPAPSTVLSPSSDSSLSTSSSAPSSSISSSTESVEGEKPSTTVERVSSSLSEDNAEEGEGEGEGEEGEEKPKFDIVDDDREHLNIVFIGHVDAGKSTISGNLLYLTGMVDQRTVQKYQKDADSANRGSWYLAYIMDTNEEERAKGKTVEVGRAHFETPTKRYTILDAPGHKNYVPNMIGGAAQADIGVLVISARKGEFETGFENGGQTREHAMLAKTLGVNKLVVVINKMDEKTVNWSKERYDECVNGLGPYLRKCGYNKNDILFLPVSGYSGANLKEPVDTSLCPWWDGLSLVQTLDALPPLNRNPEAPLRIPIIYKYKDRGSVIAMGKVESGTVTVGDKIVLQPGKIDVEVLGVATDLKELRRARPGENVKLSLKGVEEEHLMPGFVLCSREKPTQPVSEFEAQLVIMDLLPHKSIFTAGYSAVIHCHSAVEEVICSEILSEFDKKTKKPSKRVPKFVKTGSIIKAKMDLSQPICMELFSEFPQLGRFTLRDEGKTIAIGKVVHLGPRSAAAQK